MISATIVIRALAINLLPKKTFLVLWGIAITRLLRPFSIPAAFSVYSLMGSYAPAAVPPKDPKIVGMPTAELEGAMPGNSPDPAGSIPMWAVVWAAGMLACALVFAIPLPCHSFGLFLCAKNFFPQYGHSDGRIRGQNLGWTNGIRRNFSSLKQSSLTRRLPYRTGL